MNDTTHDPLEAAGADLGGFVRSAATAAVEVTRAAAGRQTERDRQARRVADDELRTVAARTRAEQAAAALLYHPVGHDRWWDHATPADVAAAWTAAQGWETRDPHATRAIDEIRSRLASHPDLADQLRDQYGLTLDDHPHQQRSPNRDRQATSVTAAGMADLTGPAETTEELHGADPPAAQTLPGSPAERAAAVEVADLVDVALRAAQLAAAQPPDTPTERAAAADVAGLVDTSFPMGRDQPFGAHPEDRPANTSGEAPAQRPPGPQRGPNDLGR